MKLPWFTNLQVKVLPSMFFYYYFYFLFNFVNYFCPVESCKAKANVKGDIVEVSFPDEKENIFLEISVDTPFGVTAKISGNSLKNCLF